MIEKDFECCEPQTNNELRDAIMALVEQQRIGNRIALAKVVAETERYYGMNGCRAGLVGHEAALYDNDIDSPPLRADIREGLGLGKRETDD
jgi:hypothetical protein